MKTFIKLLLLVVFVLGVALPMFITGPDGRTLMKPSDWVPDAGGLISDVRRWWSGDEAATLRPSLMPSKTMYKWQDQQGQWHFSEEIPPGITTVSLEALPEVKNVIESSGDIRAGSSNIGFSLEHASELLEKVSGDADQ